MTINWGNTFEFLSFMIVGIIENSNEKIHIWGNHEVDLSIFGFEPTLIKSMSKAQYKNYD